jgi:uncharacterized protein YqcC (DUF446 family)
MFVQLCALSLSRADLKNFSSGFPTTSAFTSAEYSRPVTKHPTEWLKIIFYFRTNTKLNKQVQ